MSDVQMDWAVAYERLEPGPNGNSWQPHLFQVATHDEAQEMVVRMNEEQYSDSAQRGYRVAYRYMTPWRDFASASGEL